MLLTFDIPLTFENQIFFSVSLRVSFENQSDCASLSLFTLTLIKWSCRESNPGPNKQSISFLHVYSVINFHEQPGNRQPNWTLLPEFSSWLRQVIRIIPGSRVPLDPLPQGKVPERQLVPTT